MIVFVDGTSFIPKIGNQTQNIPPTTSVKDNNVNSAAGIAFEPIEYKFFFFKQKTAYEIHERLVGSEMCIRDRQKTDP